jgi:hypothetical protein
MQNAYFIATRNDPKLIKIEKKENMLARITYRKINNNNNNNNNNKLNSNN